MTLVVACLEGRFKSILRFVLVFESLLELVVSNLFKRVVMNVDDVGYWKNIGEDNDDSF